MMDLIKAWSVKLYDNGYETYHLYDDRMITMQTYDQLGNKFTLIRIFDLDKPMCQGCCIGGCIPNNPTWNTCIKISSLLGSEFSISSIKLIGQVSLIAVSYMLNYGNNKDRIK